MLALERPEPPRIVNYDALQNWSGAQALVSWSAPAGMGVAYGSLQLIDETGRVMASIPLSSFTSPTSVTIPALAVAPGTVLTGELSIVYPNSYLRIQPRVPDGSLPTLGKPSQLILRFSIRRASLAPAISAQPASRTVTAGIATSFSVTATSTNLSYQWFRNSIALPGATGATSATLTLNAVQAADAGDYSVVVSNTSGSVTSAIARLSVTSVILAPAITVQPLAQTITNGGAVTLGVATSGTDLAYQWQHDGVPIPGATTATLTLSSARLAHAGRYSVTVSNGAGRVTSQTVSLTVNAVTRISNLSILAPLASSGDSFMIGYVVGGDKTVGAKPLLIRAVGPSLGALGVPGTVDDPKLELFAGSTKTGENDNWGGGATLGAAFAAVGAFALPTGSRDAAVVATLAPGNYSVEVKGVNNGTGFVLVEVYEVP